MRTLAVNQSIVKFNNFKSNEAQPKVTDVPNGKKPKKPILTKENALPLVSAAVAVASLGVSAYALSRGKKGGRDIEMSLRGKLSEAEMRAKKAAEELVSGCKKDVEKVSENVANLGKKVEAANIDAKINDMSRKVDSYQEAVVNKMNEVANKTRNIVNRTVEVNGTPYTLATTMHGYGARDAELTRTLQTESARRALGITPLVALTGTAITARFLTSEYQGFIKTGGMGVVPEELIANLGAYVNDKQDINIIADTPLYLGAVENDKVARLERSENGNYDYVAYTEGGTKRSVMAELEEMGSFPIEMYDDYNKTTETVRIFRTAKELEAKVDFDDTMNQLRPEIAEKVKEALANGHEYRVGPLLFKPEVDVNRVSVKVGDKKNVNINYEGFLSLFTDEAANVIRNFMEAGTNVELKNVKEMLATIRERKAIEEMQAQGVNPNEFKGRLEAIKNQPIEVFKEGISKEVFVEIIANEEDAKLLSDYMSKTNSQIPQFKITPKSAQKVVTKYRAVFYDNKRFDLSGPFHEVENKTIYNDRATSSGETERFLALSKFFYEHLMPDNQSYLKKPLNADIIIGNDWQSGGVAAMVRYLTPARKAFGLEASVADKIQNTPIITLMHNFKLRGAVYHSQERLLNMMFGEHAAKIVENAYAPNGAGLSPHLWNALFAEKGINPQTMALHLSDYVPFVSVGNFTEASTEPARGGINYELAALRGRQGKFSDMAFLKKIAIMNDLDESQISAKPTAGGITNGCDRINNIISKEKARAVEMYLGLPTGSLMTAEDIEKMNAEGKNGAYIAHQNNKRVNLDRVLSDIKLAKDTNGAVNPMKLFDIENTDLTGVNENTMIIGMAGRIVDQKGIDIESEGILEYYKSGNFDAENPPVFYIQGKGDMKYLNRFWEVKKEVAQINKKAADRMIFCNLFSEAGRYDACKMFSDFSSMPSWDEPCGLVHKEIAYASGAIPIVNKVGGLRDGLFEYGSNGENAIFVDFMDKDNNPIEKALPYNGKSFAKGLVAAQDWYQDKARFEKGIEASYNGHYDWLGGKIQQYVEILQGRGVIKKEI